MTRSTLALALLLLAALVLATPAAMAQPGAAYHDDVVRRQAGETPRDLTRPSLHRGPGARAHRRAVDARRATSRRIGTRPIDRRMRVAPAPDMVPPASIRQGRSGFSW